MWVTPDPGMTPAPTIKETEIMADSQTIYRVVVDKTLSRVKFENEDENGVTVVIEPKSKGGPV